MRQLRIRHFQMATRSRRIVLTSNRQGAQGPHHPASVWSRRAHGRLCAARAAAHARSFRTVHDGALWALSGACAVVPKCALCRFLLTYAVQVVTTYSDAQLPQVLEACERIPHHLTAAVVSNDIQFAQRVLGSTVNGTTYVGRRARTTGAPQNHWFGPAGDPRGAGIGSAEAIQMVWSCHREIINDFGPVNSNWSTPGAI